MSTEARSWMEIMTWIAADPGRPLVLVVLAQSGGIALDEMNLASRAGLLQQQITGSPVETAVMVKHIMDLAHQGFLERDEGGFRWRMTRLGELVSRQWVPGDTEPASEGALSHDDVRAWRDRILAAMEHDATLADAAGIAKGEWILTQSQRLVEVHVLNRVLGEQELPEWLSRMREDAGVDLMENLQA